MRTMRLPCELKDPDRLVLQKSLTAALKAQEEAEAEKAEKMKEVNARIKEHKTTVHTLNTSLDTGFIEREVEIRYEKDVFNGVVRTIRLDDNSVVDTRALDAEERQVDIEERLLKGGKDATVLPLNGDATEEQRLADDPEEAEEMRNERLAKEAAERLANTTIPKVGDIIEVFPPNAPDWVPAEVKALTETTVMVSIAGEEFEARLEEVSMTWRWPPTWSEVKDASDEKARQEEIERLAAEQAADAGPKTLLKAPKNGKAAKKNAILDGDDKPIVIPDLPPEQPPELCLKDCAIEHEHTAERTAF